MGAPFFSESLTHSGFEPNETNIKWALAATNVTKTSVAIIYAKPRVLVHERKWNDDITLQPPPFSVEGKLPEFSVLSHSCGLPMQASILAGHPKQS